MIGFVNVSSLRMQGWAAPAAVAVAAASAALATVPGAGPLIVGALAAVLAGVLLPFRTTATLLIVASGFTVVEIPVGGIDLRPDIALLPTALIACAAAGRLRQFSGWLRHPVFLLLWGLLLMHFTSSLAFSPDIAASLLVAVWQLLNLLIVAVVLAAFGLEREALERRLLATAVLISASGLLAWGAAAIADVNGWGASEGSGFGLRARGIAFEPNILGATTAFWALVLLTFPGRLSWRRKMALVLFVLTLPLTSTRAAVVALAFGSVTYLLRQPSKLSRLGLILATSALAFLLIGAVAPSSLTPIVQKLSELSFTDQTATYRYTSWKMAVDDLNSLNWLIGMGTNSFGQRHLDPTLPGQEVGYYLGSLPIQTLYDVGLIGLGLLLAAGWALRKYGNGPRRVALLATFLIISTATSPFFFANWWLLVALGLATEVTSKESVDTRDEWLAVTQRAGNVNVSYHSTS